MSVRKHSLTSRRRLLLLSSKKYRASFDYLNNEDGSRSFSKTSATIFYRQSILYQKNIHKHRCENIKFLKNGCTCTIIEEI